MDASWERTPTVGDWAQVKDKPFEERCMEVYAAMVDSMDQGVGRIVEALKGSGQLENTLILYLQDNGGCGEGNGRGTNFTARAESASLPPMHRDAPQVGSQPKQTRDGWPVRQGCGVMPGGQDTYVAYGREWANVSNTPFREYKHWTHEGGIATPLIAHWPAGILVSQRGRLNPTPGQLVDILATCVDLGKATYPTERSGQSIRPMEGVSLRPAFEGKRVERPRPLMWEHEGNRAIRVGEWKLVTQRSAGAWELYDLKKDRTETKNLAGQEPDRVKSMAWVWEVWAKRAQVFPWPWEAVAKN